MGAAPELIEETTHLPRPSLAEVLGDKVLTEASAESGNAETRIGAQEWVPSMFFLLFDIVSWIAIYGIASYIRRDAFFSGSFEFATVDLIYLGVIIQALFIIGGYDRHTEMRSLSYTAEHILAIMAAAAISSIFIYIAATFDASMKPSRGVVLASFILFTPVSIVYRRAIRRALASVTAGKTFLVVGAGKLAADFYRAYRESENQQGLEFVDITGARAGQGIAGPDTPVVLGDVTARLKNLGRYSGVILAERLENLDQGLIEGLVRTQFHAVRVYTLESFYETHWRHVPVHSIDPFWPLQMGFQLARASPYHYLKRLFDIVAAGSGLILFLPLMGPIALLLLLTNGRPAFFQQVRVGRDGQTFTVIKFRTMKRNGSDAPGDLYTRANDPRVHRVGNWLRKLRLDELPQLWNVLKGEMSLIGPRAEWVNCAARYESKIPFYHFRHLVKPGITGWAQVNYPYGEGDEDAIEKLKYDLYYIRHYSLKLDAMIVLKTIHTMLFSKGR
jgi:exopolysaccharide biosynthesis polyprenyl glycosylphosphotransferase